MNWAWWDGKMPLAHYLHEHGLDSETLLQAVEQGPDSLPANEGAPEPPVNGNTAVEEKLEAVEPPR